MGCDWIIKIMNTQGFYKYQDGELYYGPSYVEGPGIFLSSCEKDSYEYPVGGWIWAESEEEARAYFNTEITLA
jgi:hypothetical protein